MDVKRHLPAGVEVAMLYNLEKEATVVEKCSDNYSDGPAGNSTRNGCNLNNGVNYKWGLIEVIIRRKNVSPHRISTAVSNMDCEVF